MPTPKIRHQLFKLPYGCFQQGSRNLLRTHTHRLHPQRPLIYPGKDSGTLLMTTNTFPSYGPLLFFAWMKRERAYGK